MLQAWGFISAHLVLPTLWVCLAAVQIPLSFRNRVLPFYTVQVLTQFFVRMIAIVGCMR
jgi:hypothetical protein